MKSTATTFEELKNEISNLKIDENLEFDDDSKIQIWQYVHLDHKGYGDGMEYSWVASQKPPYGYMYSFPMKDTNYIKTFKTRSGAERNLLKRVSWLFEHEIDD